MVRKGKPNLADYWDQLQLPRTYGCLTETESHLLQYAGQKIAEAENERVMSQNWYLIRAAELWVGLMMRKYR